MPIAVDLRKLRDVVKMMLIAKIKSMEDKIPDITSLATNTTLNAKTIEVKNKIPNITNLAATTTALTAVENKMLNVSNLVKKLTITQQISEIELLIMIMINTLLLKNLIN